MKAFRVNTNCRTREELSRTEWVRLVTYVNMIQPSFLSLHAEEDSVRIENPKVWNGEGSAFVKPYRRPYAVELQRISLTSYVTRLYRLKWIGEALAL